MIDAQMLSEVADRAQTEAGLTTSLPRCAYLAGIEDALRWVMSGEAGPQLATLLDGQDEQAA